MTFSPIHFFAALFCLYGDHYNAKQEAKQKKQNSNENSTFSRVSLIGLWTTWPRMYAFSLAFIYISLV